MIGKLRFRDSLTIGSKIYYETNYAPLLQMQGFLKEVALDLKTSTGGILPVLVTSDVIRDTHGKPALVRSTLFNISDRRMYEAELLAARLRAESSEEASRESHEWFQTTLQSIGDAVIAINLDKTVSYLNKVAEELTGWKLAEASGRPMSEVFNIINDVTGEPAFNPVDKVLRDGSKAALTNHTALVRRDKTKIIIEDSASPIKTDATNLKGVVLVFRDITAKHNEDQERLRLLDQLTKEQEIRETFVATLTHDLRTPLTAIKMSAQLIMRKPDQADLVQSLAVRVLNGMTRADQMIQDLLDVNALRAGEMIALDMDPFELHNLMAETIADLSSVHGDRFMLTGDKSIEVKWNANAIRRAVENLCNNAVKYGSPRSTITISILEISGQVTIGVHNTGNPISLDDQKNLFALYKRTHSAHESAVKGWGIGLTLVRGVVEAHHGRVFVESGPEKGTTFCIEIPVAI